MRGPTLEKLFKNSGYFGLFQILSRLNLRSIQHCNLPAYSQFDISVSNTALI